MAQLIDGKKISAQVKEQVAEQVKALNEKGIPVMNEGTQDYFKGSKASNQGLNLPRIVESTVAYMTARKYADRQKDFTVYNATRGGKLEAFERVKLEDVLAKKGN